MGHEEVETVLPADFVPRPDPAPANEENSLGAPVDQTMDAEYESEAEDSACGGKRRKSRRKSKRSSSSRGLLTRWRSARSKSRSRKSSKSTERGNKSEVSKDEKNKSKSSKLSFRTIRQTDSSGTERRSNTAKAKEDRDASTTKGEHGNNPADEDREVKDINSNVSAALPTVREGSPDNTTVTALTGERSVAEENNKVDIASPSPAPTVESLSAMSIEVGDENDQFEVAVVESPEEEDVETAEVPAIAAAPSKDASVLSTKSSRSIKSKKSSEPLAIMAAPSKEESVRSTKSNRSIKSKKSPEPLAIMAAPSKEESVRSTKSARSTKSNRSIKSKRSSELVKETDITSADNALVAVLDEKQDDAASVRSSKSTKSTSSKRSLRSLRSKKSKDVKEEEPSAEEDKGEEKAQDETPAAAVEEATVSDKENATADTVEEAASPKSNWTKKVSLSIGGYKTSFQFSDPMANLAEAVNTALDVGNEDAMVQQAKDLDDIDGEEKTEEVGDERDYDESPTRLFMYLQQRAWGLALTQLQQHPEEASVWVYRKAKPEKAHNVPDADEHSQALVVQHTALVVHNGSEMPKFRWKLLPLHAAIVLGAPTEIIQDIIRAYPSAAKKTDERGSLPVHLAASRLDVDSEGEKVVLQLFGAHPDSIEVEDRKGRTPPELAKLARARKDIEGQRKCDAASTVASQKEDEGSEGSEDGEDVDDDVSVKSSLSGRFAALMRGSKSSDTMDRRKKNKNKKAKETLALAPAKSVDDADDGSVVADDASIAESLGPGFAFLKTSREQEARELNAAEVEQSNENDEEEEQEEERTEEEQLVAAKKAIVAKEYQTQEEAPIDTSSPRSIPLPMSFSMGGDESVAATVLSAVSAVTELVSKASMTDDKPVDDTSASKSVTISDEVQTQIIPEDAPVESSDNLPVNEGLRALLEKAVENAGRGGLDVTEFVKILENEWVTDVESLRRLDGETLDELLPLMLSRELQRLINHADSIDTDFLESGQRGLGRGRSLKKSSSKKKKKKKRSHRRLKKRTNTFRPVSPVDNSLTCITEDGEDAASPGSTGSDDQTQYSIMTEAQSVVSVKSAATIKSAPPTLPGITKEDNEDASSPEGSEDECEDDINQSASIEDLEIRKLHANLIADARTKFPTREALEDSISERQAEVEAAVSSGFDVDKQTLARAALADDEVRKLLPLRLILPTVTDLTEMIYVLQLHKEDAIRNLDMDKANNIQSEIDELQGQIDQEERYLMKKKMGETKCGTCGEMFPTQKRKSGILKLKEKHCEKCRGGDDTPAAIEAEQVLVETVDSRDDEEN